MQEYVFGITESGDGSERTVSPLHDKSIAIVYEKWEGQEFYRKQLSGELKFLSGDYEYILSKGVEARFELTVSNDSGLVYKGKFSYTDCEIDYDNRSVTVKRVETVDEYTRILENYDKDFDFIGLGAKSSPFTYIKQPGIQVYAEGLPSVLTYFGTTGGFDVDCTLEYDYAKLYDGGRWDVCGIVLRGEMIFERNNYGWEPVRSYDAFGYFVGKPKGLSDKIELPGKNAGCEFSGLFYSPGLDFSECPYVDMSFTLISNSRYEGGYVGQDEVVRANFPYMHNAQYRFNGGSGESGIYKLGSMTKGALLSVNEFSIAETINPSADPEDRRRWRMHVKEVIPIYTRAVLPFEVKSPYISDTYKILSDDIVGQNKNYGYVSYLYCGGYIEATAKKSADKTKWGNYDRESYYTCPWEDSDSIYPIGRSGWNEVSYFLNMYDADNYMAFSWLWGYTQKVKDSYPLWEVLDALLRNLGEAGYEPSADYSTFFHGDPYGLEPPGYTLSVTPKSNVVSGNYTIAAKKGVCSLKGIFELLAALYDAHWYVDNGHVRIEHIKYFKRGLTYSGSESASLDLTTKKVARNSHTWDFLTNVVSFDTDSLAKDLSYRYNEDTSDTFNVDGVHIDSKYVSDSAGADEVMVTGFCPDVFRLIYTNTDVKVDDMAILAIHKSLPIDVIPGATFNVTARNFSILAVSPSDLAPSGGISVKSNIPYPATIRLYYSCSSTSPGIYTHICAFDGDVVSGRPALSVQLPQSGKGSVDITLQSGMTKLFLYQYDIHTGANNAVSRVVILDAELVSTGPDTFMYGSVGYTDVGTLKTVNGELSFKVLFDRYLRFNMPGRKYHLGDGTEEDFVTKQAKGIRRSKRQTVTIPIDGNLPDPYKRVATAIGMGEVVRLSMDIITGLATIELAYDTEELNELRSGGETETEYQLIDSEGYQLVDSDGYELTVKN